jgi:cation transport ATPase
MLSACCAFSQGAWLLVLFNVSHAVEHHVTEAAQGGLKDLLERAPQTAALIDVKADGSPDYATERTVNAAEIRVGDTILVRPGQQVCRFTLTH